MCFEIQSFQIKMSSYQFKEHDEEGLHTLEAISQAHHFNAWMFEQVQPFMNGRIL